LKRNYRKSLKLLTSCHRKDASFSNTASTSASSPNTRYIPEGPVYFNNVACLYLRMQRYDAATLLFHKAMPGLAKDLQNPSASALRNGLLTHRYTTDILYNTGLSLLLSSHPLEAFRCFESTSTRLKDRPQLWVRMAECCIRYDEQKREKGDRTRARLFEKVVAKGRSRRIILRHDRAESSKSVEEVHHVESVDVPEVDVNNDRDMLDAAGSHTGPWFADGSLGPSGGGLMLEQRCSLRRSVRYLCNALYLVRSIKNGQTAKTTPGSGVKSSSGSEGNGPGRGDGAEAERSRSSSEAAVTGTTSSQSQSVTTDPNADSTTDTSTGDTDTSAPLRPPALEENVMLQLCYVHLCLGDPICALSYAKDLLVQHTQMSDRSRFLAQTYCVEALCTLGRPSEAADLMEQQQQIVDVDLKQCVLPVAWGANGVPLIVNPNMARAVSLLNRGSTLALQGRLDEARAHIETSLRLCPKFSPAIRGLMYVYLRRGQSAQALQLLRTLRT